jgi:CBS domain-containing protein
MHSSIFFDIRRVYGDPSLIDELQQYAARGAKENQVFLRFMAANALSHRPPLGFFRRFVQEHDGSHCEEGLNLKHRGIVPITDLVRLRALESATTAANTHERIRLTAAAGLLNESDAASLADALELIGQIRLEHQARQLAAGEKATNLVPPEELSPLMRRNLKAAFMLVVGAQNALALRYQVG